MLLRDFPDRPSLPKQFVFPERAPGRPAGAKAFSSTCSSTLKELDLKKKMFWVASTYPEKSFPKFNDVELKK